MSRTTRVDGAGRLDRRRLLAGLGGVMAAAFQPTPAAATSAPMRPGTITGAASLAANGFAALTGKRVGLITNQTGRVGAEHLADLLARAPGVTLAALFAPEHGIRGAAEAGARIVDGRDPTTGVPVYSLYGATRAPKPEMLAGLDVLVFDIQDVGARFYTFISTMGLALQAAAKANLRFVVLDRPNPLGGSYVSGFVLEPRFKSFVGQYPIPIVHGMTVGELATMIKGERWLAGVEGVDLEVVRLEGWTRAMRFPATGLDWVATSPNIPSFLSALTYPGIGIVGETLVNEGRGTPIPFQQFGAPWLDARLLAADLARVRLPGVRFEPVRYTPQAIANVAANPRFRGESINAVRLAITDVDRYRPLETGMHALALLGRETFSRGIRLMDGRPMFHSIAGTTRLAALLDQGATGADIAAAWRREVATFEAARRKYLLYG